MSKLMNSNRRTRPGMVGILSCAAFILCACDIDTEKPLTGPQAAERGSQIFEYNCGACHGAEGQGPSLAQIKSLASAERRGKMINHPVAGQIPQRLRAHELSDLHEFFDAD